MFAWTRRILIGLIVGVLAGAAYIFFSYTYTISGLATRNPSSTSLIEARLEEAQARGKQPRKIHTWVPLARISVNLQRAVIAGEDANFATHNGFDYEAIQRAWAHAQKEAEREAKEEGDDKSGWIPAMPSFTRGASTITQQLAKNLYLSSERTILRKGREAVITFFLERELSKRRILELYLNLIEWGDGIYGAEAAAQYYFRKSAADLTPQEAAYLAAMIPNPRTVFNPKMNPKRVARRQRMILRGLRSVQLPG